MHTLVCMGLKFRVNEEFFDTWSSESAYIAGLICADGNLIDSPTIRAKYVSLTSTDFELVESMRTLMSAEHKVYVRKAHRNRKKAYLLRFGSARLFNRLVELGITPAKSHTLAFPAVPEPFLADFIRGYFDGDGCVALERSRTGGIRRLLTVFTCGSRPFIEQLQNRLINTIGVTDAKIYNHGSSHNAYQLRYSMRDSLRLFRFMYRPLPRQGLYLSRKYAIFTKYLEMRNVSDERIPSVLDSAGPVANEERIGLQNRHERVQLPPGPLNVLKQSE